MASFLDAFLVEELPPGAAPQFSVPVNTYAVSPRGRVIELPIEGAEPYVRFPWVPASLVMALTLPKLARNLIELAGPALPMRIPPETDIEAQVRHGHEGEYLRIPCAMDDEFYLVPKGAGRICYGLDGDASTAVAMGLIEPRIHWFRVVSQPSTFWERLG